MSAYANVVWPGDSYRSEPKSEMGHERRFRDVRDRSGLPPTPERLRQRSESTLRATNGSSLTAIQRVHDKAAAEVSTLTSINLADL
jgi:hypothetical protein